MPPPTWISSAHICSGIKSYLRAKDPLKRDRLHLTQLKRCDYRIITPWIADIGNEVRTYSPKLIVTDLQSRSATVMI
jgi:hypothetical protein